nr:hypothetical protein [Tanacetum cinerariifolium]
MAQNVEDRAIITGWAAADTPFKYLGIPVGSNMNRSSNWDDMIRKAHRHLATWKVRLLSISRRLTLCKSVIGSLGVFYMSMFKTPELVSQKLESGGFIWIQKGYGPRSLKERFPRVYAMKGNKQCMVSDRWVDDHDTGIGIVIC